MQVGGLLGRYVTKSAGDEPPTPTRSSPHGSYPPMPFTMGVYVHSQPQVLDDVARYFDDVASDVTAGL